MGPITNILPTWCESRTGNSSSCPRGGNTRCASRTSTRATARTSPRTRSSSTPSTTGRARWRRSRNLPPGARAHGTSRVSEHQPTFSAVHFYFIFFIPSYSLSGPLETGRSSSESRASGMCTPFSQLDNLFSFFFYIRKMESLLTPYVLLARQSTAMVTASRWVCRETGA